MLNIKTMDLLGKVVIEKDKVYRLIHNERKKETLEILQTLSDGGLIGKDIIATKPIFDHKFTDHELILEHEKLEFVTFPIEWSPKIFYDVSMFFVNLLLKIKKLKIRARDMHLFNLTLQQGKIVFFDFGSFEKDKMRSGDIRELKLTVIHPLILMYKKQWNKSKLFLEHYERITYKDISGYLNILDKIKYHFFMKLIFVLTHINLKTLALKSYKLLLRCFLPKSNKANLKNHHIKKSVDLSMADKNLPCSKQKSIINLIRNLQPQCVIDIGGNGSQYGAILAHNATKFISMETDICTLGQSYSILNNENKSSCSKYCYFTVTNFTKPTLPSHLGPIDSSGNIIPFCPALKDRLPNIDLALMFNMVHYLCFLGNLFFSEIVKQLTIFTKKYLLIEFPMREHKQVQKWLESHRFNHMQWYNTDNFISALKEKFELLERYDIESIDENKQKNNSILFLCKIKQSNAIK